MQDRIHDLVRRAERRAIPSHLSRRFTSGTDERLDRDRYEIIPWLDRTRRLDGAHILEVGCGSGVSTVALAEQGAIVTGIDVSAESLVDAQERCDALGLTARFVHANAVDLGSVEPGVDWVIFWAVLEHMTIEERLTSLKAAWRVLPDDGILTVVETPNRLWLTDAHTSRLPFFNWLPDQLAFRYASYSPRPSFGGDTYSTMTDETMLAFSRRGRGASYHEFDLALGHYDVVSCMQIERRRRNPLRRLGWATSRHGRYARAIRSEARGINPAFLQPYLYLTLRKVDLHRDAGATDSSQTRRESNLVQVKSQSRSAPNTDGTST